MQEASAKLIKNHFAYIYFERLPLENCFQLLSQTLFYQTKRQQVSRKRDKIQMHNGA